MNIIIIDDENRVRSLIKKIIPTDELGMCIIGEASNGLDSLELCMKLKPDIIITDIRMPGMDGLALLEEMGKSLPNSKVILISGYDDFSYAQKAIKLGAYDYILKPIAKEELKNILLSAKSKILKARKEKEEDKKIKLELSKLQNHILDNGDRTGIQENQSDHALVNKALAYMKENYNNGLTLEETASKIFMNPGYFSDIFKRTMGKGFNEYISELRMEKAKLLLKIPELKVKEIANMVGYADDSYFIKVFKKYTGTAPCEFRK